MNRQSSLISPDDQLYTAREVAGIIGVSLNTIRRWTNCGRLQCYRLNRRGDRRFRMADVTRFLLTGERDA